MIKFIKEEISLCKQVAEKHRKEIFYGDWYFNERMGITHCWTGHPSYYGKVFIPLWTISDCLEFLRKRCEDHVFLSHDEDDDEEWYLWFDEYKKTQQMGKGKTPLEACLKAVLAVLEEGK